MRVAGSRLERCMSPQILVKRVEQLEERVTILEQLPARIDDLTSQISQLRDEMRGEFSAVRGEMASGLAAVRAEMREEIRAGDEETRRVLGDQIRAGDDEIMSHARVLHEDLISRWALSQEGNPRRGKRR
jgi:predicted phage gp36 major capsid-like protein